MLAQILFFWPTLFGKDMYFYWLKSWCFLENAYKNFVNSDESYYFWNVQLTPKPTTCRIPNRVEYFTTN